MATTTQRPGKRAKQSPHTSHRVGPRDHFNQHPMTSSVPQSNLPGVYSNPDMAYALVNIVGCIVDVQMQSGAVYQGVLKAVSPKLSIALALAHDKTKVASKENTEKLMQLEFADIVTVSVLPDSNPSKDIFKTDTEISHPNGSSSSQELQPFSFDDDSTPLALNDGSSGWSAEEMFAINRTKFNVESSYDEEMTDYTTKLERTDTKDFQQREERAEKLAQEIEKDTDRHKIDDAGTEEELFSSVVRHKVAEVPPTLSAPISQHHISPVAQSNSSLSDAAQNSEESPADMKGAGACLESLTGTDSFSSPIGSSLSLSPTDAHSHHSNDQDGGTSLESGIALSEGHQSPPIDQAGEGQAKGLVVEEERDREVEQDEIASPVAGTGAETGEEGTIKETDVLPSMDITSEAQTPESSQDKAINVRKFRLDPNAKEFNPGAAPFLSISSSIGSQSSASAVIDSTSLFRPPQATSHNLGTGKRYPKRGRGQAPLQYPQESVAYVSTSSGNYMFSQAQQAAVVRQQVPSGQMIQYPAGVHQFGMPFAAAAAGTYINAQGHGSQHMVNAKFMGGGDISPQHQMYAGGGQQLPLHMNLVQQPPPPHNQMIPNGSQSQLSSTHAGLVPTPPGPTPAISPQMMLMQGNISPQHPQGTVYQHNVMQVTGVMPQVGGQNQAVMAQNRYVYSPQHPQN